MEITSEKVIERKLVELVKLKDVYKRQAQGQI